MANNWVRILIIIIFLPAFIYSCLSKKSQASLPFPNTINITTKTPDSFLVKFETTKGDFTMKARRYWSPVGTERFYQLVTNHFYDGNVIFRVAQAKSCSGAFVVQFGLANNALQNKAWDSATIIDEPVVVPQTAGGVVFARSGPHTRSAQVAIMVSPCAEMDTVSNGSVKGFPTFAVVEEGMQVVKSFNAKYGNSIFDHEDSMLLGREYFDRAYPGLDRIVKTKIVKEW